MALTDYDYKFTFVDVGCQGRISDGGVYRNTEFYGALSRGELGLPEPTPPPSLVNGWCNLEPLPFVFVADDAFALTENCMKPYPQSGLTEEQRVFNYHLSRFRRISENTFGIWSNRFRVFNTRLCLAPEKATMVALASIVLHNMLREKSKDSYTPGSFADEIIYDGEINDGTWRNQIMENMNLHSLPTTLARRSSQSAVKIRQMFTEYFCGPGNVPWQWKHLL